jgi:hypothetical protein
VDDAALVGVVDRPRQHPNQPGRVAGGEGPTRQRLLQGAALDQLQGQVGHAALLADLVDLHDVGVLQAGDGLPLEPEANAVHQPRRGPGQDDLEGDEPVEGALPCLVDDAHAAPPQLPQHLVVAERRRDPPARVPRAGAGGGGPPEPPRQVGPVLGEALEVLVEAKG